MVHRTGLSSSLLSFGSFLESILVLVVDRYCRPRAPHASIATSLYLICLLIMSEASNKRKRGVVRAFITRLGNRLKDLEKRDANDPSIPELTKHRDETEVGDL